MNQTNNRCCGSCKDSYGGCANSVCKCHHQPNNRIREEWRNKFDCDFDSYLADNSIVESWTARINIKLTKEKIKFSIAELLKSQREELVEKILTKWSGRLEIQNKYIEELLSIIIEK